jgi:hypothetical protein
MGLYMLSWYLWQSVTHRDDPAPSLLRSRSSARSLECERLPVGLAADRYPGVVAPVGPRGDLIERSVLVCSQRMVDPELRRPADEAILSSLGEHADRMARLASLRPELQDATWLVESHTTNPEVDAKLSFATKNALVERGLLVSDRSPLLGFDDLDVITRMEPFDAYPAACARYAANGSLGPDQVLLAPLVLDRRETAVHAGLCVQGAWTWLQ